MTKYNVSICLLTKDENDYLDEWLDWHIKAGVDHFFIYDNGSKTPVRDSINPDFLPMCTIVDFSGDHRHIQNEAYDDALARFKDLSTWMAFIDTDEFIRICDESSIPDFLRKFDGADCVVLRWVVYGADGQLHKDARPVRERFTVPATYPEGMPRCKSIIRPDKIEKIGAHFPARYYNDTVIVNEYGARTTSAMSPIITGETAVIDHYFTRSYEEWQNKMARGSCDPFYSRPNDLFVIINPEMENLIESLNNNTE